MKTFWNNSDGFSIKDLLSILLGALFIGMVIFSVYTSDPARVITSLEAIRIIAPIILTIVGGYAATEGTKGVMDTYYNNRSNNEPPNGGGEI
jgi:hypothetical protein